MAPFIVYPQLPGSIGNFFDMMQILLARSEHTDSSSFRLDDRSHGLVFRHITVDEQESATLEITLIIAQIQ